MSSTSCSVLRMHYLTESPFADEETKVQGREGKGREGNSCNDTELVALVPTS